MSPKGTKIIAQGKAEGRNPGITTQNDTDPVRVEQTNAAVAPLQGAEDIADRDPGFHPGVLSSSPTATKTTTPFSISRSFRNNSTKRRKTLMFAANWTKICGDFTAFSRDFTALSGDLTALSGDFTVLNDDFTAFSRDFTALNRDFTALNRDFTANNRDITANNRDITANNRDLAA
ncbi:MAG TPA: hypothetical protein PKC65_01045 [Pyrinomonadaceae bacterium]|nr:hypothetical protein [Pyrinomonadaceae bacterium]